MDEATSHLYIDFIPFTTGSKRGLSTRVSLKQALADQGITAEGRSLTERDLWLQKEKKKTISDLKAKIQSLTAELSAVKAELAQYKSVRGKLRTADLEQENSSLCSKIRSYESTIERNNLWHIFNPLRNNTRNQDDVR